MTLQPTHDTPLFSSIIPCVIYLRSGSDSISRETLLSLEKETGYEFIACDTICSFLNRVNDPCVMSPSLILLDHDITCSDNAMITDLVSMITTVLSYTNRKNSKTHIAVVINNTCTKEFLKKIQRTSVNGIVPGTDCLGYNILLSSINTLLEGEYYWPKSVIDLLTEKTNQKIKKEIQLTPRQKEVLTLVCSRGLSNKKIASVLKISESTVKVHIGTILKSYCVQNRTQLVLAVNNSTKEKITT